VLRPRDSDNGQTIPRPLSDPAAIPPFLRCKPINAQGPYNVSTGTLATTSGPRRGQNAPALIRSRGFSAAPKGKPFARRLQGVCRAFAMLCNDAPIAICRRWPP
jgi:hypothetical protein